MASIDNRIDWNAIRAEYIGGGISTRKLAAKHNVSYNTLKDVAVEEGWSALREQANSKSTAQAQQRTAEAAADNATIAQEIRSILLKKMLRMAEQIPDDSTEMRKRIGQKTQTIRLKDITSAYKDLTSEMSPSEETLKAAKVLLEGIRSAIDE